MPFCPKCRDEFQDWVKVCPDCGVGLVDKLQPIPKSVASGEIPVVPEKLVTIASFSHPEEAYIVSTKLESEGIRSFVADAHTVTANWLYSNAIGGVKVQVRESDAAEAARILRLAKQDIHAAISTGETCPKCNSADIHYETFSLRPVFVSWLLSFLTFGPEGAFIFPFLRRKWKCRTCGHQWRNRS
jgi:hypothetical protein